MVPTGEPGTGLSFHLTPVSILVWFLAWPRMVESSTVSPFEGRACDCLLTLGITAHHQEWHSLSKSCICSTLSEP